MHDATLATATGTAVLTLGLSAYAALIFIGIALAIYYIRRHRNGPAIAAATHRVLRPGGAFLVYQFSAKARDFMAKHFARIDAGFEALNILPCKLFWGWKD